MPKLNICFTSFYRIIMMVGELALNSWKVSFIVLSIGFLTSSTTLNLRKIQVGFRGVSGEARYCSKCACVSSNEGKIWNCTLRWCVGYCICIAIGNFLALFLWLISTEIPAAKVLQKRISLFPYLKIGLKKNVTSMLLGVILIWKNKIFLKILLYFSSLPHRRMY